MPPTLTPQDLPQQFESVKDTDEEFLWVGEPSFVPFILTGVPVLVGGFAWGAFDYFGFIRHMSPSQYPVMIPFFLLHLAPFYMSILNMFRLLLVHKNTFYAVTNKRVMMRSGFWGIDFKSIDFDKISDVEATVNPLENLLGVGTLRFYAGRSNRNGNPVTDNFIAVPNPYDVFRQVKTASVDIKTDWSYPNKLRPAENPGYQAKYEKR
jgi:hypothetical protein